MPSDIFTPVVDGKFNMLLYMTTHGKWGCVNGEVFIIHT